MVVFYYAELLARDISPYSVDFFRAESLCNSQASYVADIPCLNLPEKR